MMITKLLLDTNFSHQTWPAGTPVRFLGFAPGDCVAVELPNGAEATVSARRVEAMHEPEESIQALAEEFSIDYDTLYKAVYDGRVMARKSGKTWLTTRTAIQYAIKEGKMKTAVIRAEQTEAGWKLVDQHGNDVQEGFEYDTEAEALEAAEQLWPTNSAWHGRKVNSGWQIDTD